MSFPASSLSTAGALPSRHGSIQSVHTVLNRATHWECQHLCLMTQTSAFIPSGPWSQTGSCDLRFFSSWVFKLQHNLSWCASLLTLDCVPSQPPQSRDLVSQPIYTSILQLPSLLRALRSTVTTLCVVSSRNKTPLANPQGRLSNYIQQWLWNGTVAQRNSQ